MVHHITLQPDWYYFIEKVDVSKHIDTDELQSAINKVIVSKDSITKDKIHSKNENYHLVIFDPKENRFAIHENDSLDSNSLSFSYYHESKIGYSGYAATAFHEKGHAVFLASCIPGGKAIDLLKSFIKQSKLSAQLSFF